ncbi:MAG: M23 family metallopeptidase [Myxococcota bacterium]
MRIAAPYLLVALTAGCAAPSAEWRTDEVDALRGEPAVPVPLRKNPVVLRVQNPNDLAQLELELLRFGSNRRSLAEHLQGGTDWPPPMQALWIDLLSKLEDAFRPSNASPSRRLLVQARVASEVERDLTERKFGRVPEEVKERLDRLYILIAFQMQRTEPKTFTMVGVGLSWPVAPVVVTSPFGYRHDPMNDRVRFHSGVDLGGTRGDVVSAAAPGRVVHADWLGGYGRAVIVQHTEGYQTLYGHLGNIMVAQGDAIDSGTPVGLMGSSGRSTGPHLHFEVRQNGTAVDPQELLSSALLSSLAP